MCTYSAGSGFWRRSEWGILDRFIAKNWKSSRIKALGVPCHIVGMFGFPKGSGSNALAELPGGRDDCLNSPNCRPEKIPRHIQLDIFLALRIQAQRLNSGATMSISNEC
jgi:hypothetical protein